MPESLLMGTLQKVRRHPWWAARAKLSLSLLDKHRVLAPASVMDVGCGWGVNLEMLENAGYKATGLDISRNILELVDNRHRQLIQADLNQEFPENHETYDALLALDVIEHLDDDQAAVKKMAKLLRPGGIAIISVPALPELFSEFDIIQGHRRRYVPQTLQAVFENTGLKVREIFWWGAWMIPILRRMRLSTSSSGQTRTYKDYLRVPPWPLNVIMKLAFYYEESRAIRGQLRRGTSLFAVADRQS
jgi:SAM-dependent methyltransferase